MRSQVNEATSREVAARPSSTAVVVLVTAAMLTAAVNVSAAAAARAQDPQEPTSGWASSDFVWPVSGTDQVDAPMTSPFGPRLRGSQGFAYDYHRGIDVKADEGTPIYAIASGTIRIAGDHPAYSDMIVQLKLTKSGAPNLYVNYVHLSGATVVEGQYVEQGELLGYTGVSESGFAHLHFEIREGGLYQKHARNPLSFLPFPASGAHTVELEVTDMTSVADGTGRDVLVRVSAPFQELDIDGVRLSTHADRQLDSPAPVDLGIPGLEAWRFGFESLNSTQTPIVNGSSDISILDQPTVVLDAAGPAQVVMGPGRFDGRTPPWDIATYEFRFVDVPIPDPAEVPYHLVAVATDTSGNDVLAWESPTFATDFDRVDAPNFHTGNGSPLALRVQYSDELDPADGLSTSEISCSLACDIEVINVDPELGVVDLLVDPVGGAEELVVRIESAALTDTAGRPVAAARVVLPADNWAPEVVGSIDQAPNTDRWINRVATIEWQVIDPEPSAGLAADTLAPTTVDRLGMTTYLSETVCDLIGNCRRGEFTVGFDNIAPVAVLTDGPGPGESIPVADYVTPACAGSDEHSGVAADSCTVTTTSQRQDQLTEVVTATMRATDRAGNSSESSWSFLLVYETAETRIALRSVAADLSVLANLEADDAADVAEAIAALEELDDDRYWLDDARLSDQLGPTAFRIAQTALRAIDHVERAEAQQATLDLLGELRALSVLRITDATEASGNPTLLDRAAERLATGDEFADGGRFSRSSTYYRYAWFWARQAARDPALTEPQA